MKIKQVLQEKDNALFKRKEVKLIVKSDKNPTMTESAKIFAEKYSKPENAITIKSIKGKFGRDTFLISANVYDSESDKKSTEVKFKKKKKQ